MKSKVIIVSFIVLFICGILFSVVYINGFRDQTIDTETIIIDESDSIIEEENHEYTETEIIIIDESDSIIEENHEYTPYQ